MIVNDVKLRRLLLQLISVGEDSDSQSEMIVVIGGNDGDDDYYEMDNNNNIDHGSCNDDNGEFKDENNDHDNNNNNDNKNSSNKGLNNYTNSNNSNNNDRDTNINEKKNREHHNHNNEPDSLTKKYKHNQLHRQRKSEKRAFVTLISRHKGLAERCMKEADPPRPSHFALRDSAERARSSSSLRVKETRGDGAEGRC